MSPAHRRLRLAAAALTLLFVLSPMASVARAGEEGPPDPDPRPGCVIGAGWETLFDTMIDLGAGILGVAL